MPNIYNEPPVGQNNSGGTNPLLPEVKVEDVSKLYTDEDKQYLSYLQTRLENAKKLMDQPYPEFNNKTRFQYYEENEKIANTNHLDAKKNDDDVIVSAGTIEAKLDALLSNVNNLNLSSDIFPFDKENNKVAELGQALEDIIHDTEIRDGGDGGGDEEKKMLRQRELFKQGTVFVQEEWLRKFEMKKKLKGSYDGKFKGIKREDLYDGKLELVFEGPTRTLLYGPNVYLGDITEFYQSNQPYMFVVIKQSFELAKSKYGKFENWNYVKAGGVTSSDTEGKTIFDNKWRLTELTANQVEIIMYQDKPNDEFQIIINGVCMLPIGFPLSAVSPRGEYNIAKQIFRVLNDKFALGGSFVASGSVKEVSALIDEMLKLFVLKTRKSFTPAYINTSGRVIDKKVLSPGRISMGIDPQALSPIAGNETQGVTAGELGVLKEMQELINKSTVSEQFQGQQGNAGMTATEVMELQRQARLTLGLTIAVCSLLEKKLTYLRLYNILENWFEPTGSRVDGVGEARKLVNTYRSTNRETNIEGEGMGNRIVYAQDGELPTPEHIRQNELQDEKKKGSPIRRVYISPQGLRNAELQWYVQINPKEKESSPFYKMIFREQLNDILTLMQLGSKPNLDGLEEEFSRVWGKSRSKIFQKASAMPGMGGVSADAGGLGEMAAKIQGTQNSKARGRTNPAGAGQMPGM